MDRREFLGWVSVGGVVGCLPATLAACTPQSSPSDSQATAPRADGFVEVGTVADLDQKGQIAAKDAAGNPVLVVRNPANAEAIVAVNPTCTHAGCAVNWTQDQQEFVCPCHSSKFAIDGKVLQGPATAPLPTYTAKLEGNTILVKQG
ncbi:MAG TPA: ubiquinol-cytochrome c reductase iron-sulfur subunit [Allocoleopsis sp.]